MTAPGRRGVYRSRTSWSRPAANYTPVELDTERKVVVRSSRSATNYPSGFDGVERMAVGLLDGTLPRGYELDGGSAPSLLLSQVTWLTALVRWPLRVLERGER
jgi:hypothetical protein